MTNLLRDVLGEGELVQGEGNLGGRLWGQSGQRLCAATGRSKSVVGGSEGLDSVHKLRV